MAENEKPVEQQPPAEPAKPEAQVKPAKKAKTPKAPKLADTLYLPVLAEFAFAFAVIFLVVVFLAMVITAWMNRTSLPQFVLRTSVAILALGSLLMLVARQIAMGVLRVTQDEVEEMQKKAAEEAEKAQADAEKDAAEPAKAELSAVVKATSSVEPGNIEILGIPEAR